MPKENKKLYPKNWKQIRENVLKRAKNKCEWPGCSAKDHKPHPITGAKVVLTIAHRDHNPKNNNMKNLRAWCTKHHYSYDTKHRIEGMR